MAVIPAHCFHINERLAFTRLALRLLMTIGIGMSAHLAIPQEWTFAPLWIAYAAINGTVATGLWVVAHECGHHAFTRRKRVETAVGFLLHSALLVPYFTCTKSCVGITRRQPPHGRRNPCATDHSQRNGRTWARLQHLMGRALGLPIIACNLLLGWFVYAAVGGLSTSERGYTSHLWPLATRLSPGRWKAISSTAGLPLHGCSFGMVGKTGWLGDSGVALWWAVSRRQRLGCRLCVAASHRMSTCRIIRCERLDVDSRSVPDCRSSLRSTDRLPPLQHRQHARGPPPISAYSSLSCRTGDPIDRDRVSPPLPV